MYRVIAETPTATIDNIVRTIESGGRVVLTLSADSVAAVAIANDIIKRTKGRAVEENRGCRSGVWGLKCMRG